jgi:hypothetical protein
LSGNTSSEAEWPRQAYVRGRAGESDGGNDSGEAENLKEIVEKFAGQPYPVLYRAFGELRLRLGRVADHGPGYPCTFANQSFYYSKKV